eukprot:6205673-Pleurochrysis_carterae.AAC.2
MMLGTVTYPGSAKHPGSAMRVDAVMSNASTICEHDVRFRELIAAKRFFELYPALSARTV